MLSLVLIELQLGKEGKEERKSAWNGLCASLGTASGALTKCLPPPLCAFCTTAPVPRFSFIPLLQKENQTQNLLLISPLSLLKHPLFCSARFHGFPVAVGLFAWIEVEDSGSLLLEEGG